MALQLPAHNQTLELNHRMGQLLITSPLSLSAPLILTQGPIVPARLKSWLIMLALPAMRRYRE